MIRCSKCKGQKTYAGIGGIFKDCEICDATGKVAISTTKFASAEELKAGITEQSVDILSKPVDEKQESVQIKELEKHLQRELYLS